MNDDQIIQLYFDRSEQAIKETDIKYGGYCYSIAYNILSSPEDTEESVSDTYLAAWNTIPPRKPNFLNAFLGKITRHISIDRWRKISAKKRGGGEMTLVLEELDDCIAAPGCVGDGMDAKELAKAIRAFLNTLPAREQDIFLRRYFFVEESGVIAQRYGMKPATVLRTLSRTRQKLKNYLTQEGYTV